jgi:hypothetical protein
MPQKKERLSKVRQQIKDEYERNELAAILSGQTRARSITIGQASGGVIEIGMRGDHAQLWYLVNPVEAVEIIEQLAAAAGLEIAKRPKQDFTSWRSWDLEQPEYTHWKGAAPWQIDEKNRKQLSKFEERKFGALPATADLIEKPKLEATSRRKKKTQEPEETED